MERVFRKRIDKTACIPDVDLRRKVRKIRRDNGGDIGVFFVDEKKAILNWVDVNTGFELCEGDEYFELHLLNNADIVRADIKDSLTGLAYYLNEKTDIKYVIGTTYKRIAQLLSHFDFVLSRNPMPDDEDHMLEGYPRTPRGEAGKPYEEILLIFQTREQFLERYLPRSGVQV